MKVVAHILEPVEQKITLGDEGQGDAVSGVLPTDVRAIDVVQYLRGTSPDIVDRQNSYCTFSIRIYREHDSAAAATEFILTHRNEVPAVCQLEFYSGSRYAYAPQAGITPRCVWRSGAGTIFEYSVTASQFLTR